MAVTHSGSWELGVLMGKGIFHTDIWGFPSQPHTPVAWKAGLVLIFHAFKYKAEWQPWGQKDCIQEAVTDQQCPAPGFPHLLVHRLWEGSTRSDVDGGMKPRPWREVAMPCAQKCRCKQEWGRSLQLLRQVLGFSSRCSDHHWSRAVCGSSSWGWPACSKAAQEILSPLCWEPAQVTLA